MVVCCLLFVCLFVVAIFCPILACFFLKIEALIELRKMLLRKKLSHVRFGNCSTILQIYRIYKDAIDLTSR